MALGKIIKIEEVVNTSFDKKQFGGCDGYHVKTDKHDFYVLIDNGQGCCEQWGYISSEDDHGPFIGAELEEVLLTDVALKQEIITKNLGEYGFDGGGIQFVDFVTGKGRFQLAVYNSHNGYYGHGIYVLKDQEVLLESGL